MVIDWLLKGDPSIKRMTKMDLLDEESPYTEAGYISKYLTHFDEQRCLFGGGLYSPKWISTFYTTLELTHLRIQPSHVIFKSCCDHLYQALWIENRLYKDRVKRDVCVVGMLLKMLSYQKRKEEDLHDLIDYLITTQFDDGGWNCRYNDHPAPKSSSLHTTISVLEGWAMYVNQGYTYRTLELEKRRAWAHEFILKKQLFRARRTNDIIHPEMMKFHYPHRWRYDCFRALDYLQSIEWPFDERMEEALSMVKSHMEKGYIHRGKQYSGAVYFALEDGKKGRFTTLQALRILKFYDPITYTRVVSNQALNLR